MDSAWERDAINLLVHLTQHFGWLWSDELGVWIGTWEGAIDDRPDVWLRFYDRRGRLVPTAAEEARQRAERQHKRAEDERQRADAAEAEMARLKALLKKQGP